MRLVSLALCVAVAVSARAADDVRPISDAERAAVTAAADYLSRGPVAIYEQVASTPSLRQLSKGDALNEIEVRLGPPAAASWELQTVAHLLEIGLRRRLERGGVDAAIGRDRIVRVAGCRHVRRSCPIQAGQTAGSPG
ncbi:MAG: hypothetical protein AABO58_02890 [Acidobacteriota bacterium]